MNRDSLPFPRGQTGGAYDDPSTINTTGLSQLEGAEFEHIDYTPNTDGSGVDSPRTGRTVRVRVVRNKSGGALLPKRCAKMKTNGSDNTVVAGQVSGYLITVGDEGYPIDEFLPAAGVANNELFYVVVKGPAKVVSAASGDTTFGIGKFVVPDAGTVGKLVEQDTTVTGADIFLHIQGAIGRAMEAVSAINTDFLVDVRPGG